MIAVPRIQRRERNLAVEQTLIRSGLKPLLARVIAGRPLPEHAKAAQGILDGKLADLTSPFLMKGMDKSVSRLIQAIQNQEYIAVETDHDCDGQTSHAVMIHALIDILSHPRDKVLSFIGHRLQEGYGLSDALCERILKAPNQPSLVITADNGSSDEPRIAKLKAAGIDVIVTDHHAIPSEGVPESAYAVLNPTQTGCQFSDPYIAGCMVAWLLMAATRRRMIEMALLSKTVPSMLELLDFVAVGTVADCVSLARSINNRVVVQYGLMRINKFKRPCWQAIRPLLKNNTGFVGSEDLGFLIGPLLNSDGRLSDALGSVNFLLSRDLDTALHAVNVLFAQNEERKRIQKELTLEAEQVAEKQVLAGRVSLVIDLEEGHAGVHGISASRIKDQFGRPVIVFSVKQNEPDILSGSCRSIDAINIRDVLQVVHDSEPGLILKFGGHKAAAGLTIEKEKLAQFSEAFERAVSDHLGSQAIGPVIVTDGLFEDDLSLTVLHELDKLQPFGREFDEPIFEIYAYVDEVRYFGQNLNHLELLLKIKKTGQRIKAIWFFGAERENQTIKKGVLLHTIFQFSRKNRLEINLKYAKVC